MGLKSNTTETAVVEKPADEDEHAGDHHGPRPLEPTNQDPGLSPGPRLLAGAKSGSVEEAVRAGHSCIVCEVNSEPPNPASD